MPFDNTLSCQIQADLAKSQRLVVVATARGLKRERQFARSKRLPGLDTAEALRSVGMLFVPAYQFPELVGEDLADIADVSRS